MRRFFHAVAAAALVLGIVPSAQAQDGLPTVTMALSSTGELENDLKFLTSLAGKRGVATWPTIKSLLDNAFFMGVDPQQPVRMDVLLTEPRDYRLSVPYGGGKNANLMKNIELFVGGKPRRFSTGVDKVASPAFTGFIRTLTKPAYCLLAENRDNIPATFDPLKDIQPLLAAGYDMAGRVANPADGSGADERRASIDRLRKEVLDALKPLPEETETEYELRRVSLTHNLWELERLFADSEKLTLGWTTDAEKKEARLELELAALPKTDLEASIKDLAVKPSLFSKAAKGDDTILFGRVNHTLDATRQKNIDDILALIEKRTTEQIEASEDVADEHRDGLKKSVALTFQILRDGVKMGVIDGFVNVTLKDGKRSFVAGVRAPEGASESTVAILSNLVEAGVKAQVNQETEGDVAYHTVELPQSRTADFSLVLGTNTLHLATAPNAVYYAAGEGSLEQLKLAVAVTGEDESLNDGTFLESWLRVGPWIQVLKERRDKREEGMDFSGLSDVEKKAREERTALRDAALADLADGLDVVHMKLQRKDDKVVGLTTISENLLKFVGGQIVKFASEKF